jgi:hypothetical protein
VTRKARSQQFHIKWDTTQARNLLDCGPRGPAEVPCWGVLPRMRPNLADSREWRPFPDAWLDTPSAW